MGKEGVVKEVEVDEVSWGAGIDGWFKDHLLLLYLKYLNNLI